MFIKYDCKINEKCDKKFNPYRNIGTMYINPNRATFLVSDTFAGLQAARLAFKHCIFVLMHVVFRH